MMFQPCFLAVERKLRIVAKSAAPSGERKPPEICGVTGAAQQALHLARPILLLDFNQRLQFAKMMRITQSPPCQ